MTENCGTCCHWDGPKGLCKRHAPVVLDFSWNHPEHGRQMETRTVWPETLGTDWCGDHTIMGPRK